MKMEKLRLSTQMILYRNFIFIIGILMLSPSTSSCGTINLSTPEATVLGYCQGAGEEVKDFFNYSVDPKLFGYPKWRNCNIVEIKKTDEVGMVYDNELIVEKNDFEVIFEVKEITKRFGEIKKRYWNLLRKFDGKWKIISHSRIPDKYTPADVD